MVPVKSLGTVFYLPSIVTMAVSVAICEILASMSDVTLKTGLGVVHCSRSLKMAPFDRSYTSFYWSAIVNIALSCTVLELFDI